MAKRGALKVFLRSEGGPRKMFVINIFCIRPPLQVFVNGPSESQIIEYAITTELVFIAYDLNQEKKFP